MQSVVMKAAESPSFRQWNGKALRVPVFLLLLGIPSICVSQNQIVVGVGFGGARPRLSHSVAAFSMDAGMTLSRDGYLVVRGTWWDTADPIRVLGVQWGGRWPRHRWLYGEIGAMTIFYPRTGTSGSVARPALGASLGFEIDLLRGFQLQAGASQVRDTHDFSQSLGITIRYSRR
jgi:hypothetical protein